jgi:chromosome segregation ATPase
MSDATPIVERLRERGQTFRRLMKDIGENDEATVFEEAADRIAALEAERDELAQKLGEATGRIETDARLIASLEAERDRLKSIRSLLLCALARAVDCREDDAFLLGDPLTKAIAFRQEIQTEVSDLRIALQGLVNEMRPARQTGDLNSKYRPLLDAAETALSSPQGGGEK